MLDVKCSRLSSTTSSSSVQECVLGSGLDGAAAPGEAAATVLTAVGACSKLQRLCVWAERGPDLGLRCIPGSLAALGSLTSLALHWCGLWGLQQLPANLVGLRLSDSTAYALPAGLSAMTSLTRLTVRSTAAPPLAWPLRLQFLQVCCLGGLFRVGSPQNAVGFGFAQCLRIRL